MLDFKIIEISDKPWIDKLLKLSDFRGCEYCFANNLAWRRLSDTQITRYKDFYISCSRKNGIEFTFPAGQGDYKDVFQAMEEYANEHNVPLTVNSVLPSQIEMLHEIFPNRHFTAISYEDGWDYVYNASDLIKLEGKKYHGKRNHLKKLLQLDYSYEPLTEKDFDDCITYAAETYNKDNSYDDASKVSEQFAINTFFENFNELGLQGGIIRINGVIEAFTIGERINSDTLGVHIEKANAEITGAYPAINNFFAKSAGNEFTYINREEDLGIEGLRKAKKSYYPAFMIKKHSVTFD